MIAGSQAHRTKRSVVTSGGNRWLPELGSRSNYQYRGFPREDQVRNEDARKLTRNDNGTGEHGEVWEGKERTVIHRMT